MWPDTSKRASSLATGDWSYPRDTSSSSQSQSMNETGIGIPSFLQPLLGIDFVPYLPSTVETSAISSETTALTDQDLEDLDVLVGPSPELQSLGHLSANLGTLENYATRSPVVIPRSRSLGAITSDPAILEGLKPPATGEPSQENVMKLAEMNKTRRQGFGPRGGRLLNKVRGKFEERRVKKEQRRNRTGTWHGEDVASSSTTIEDSEALRWIQQQAANLATHQSQLQQVQLEAEAMKNRAKTIYERVAETQKEIVRLQTALVSTEQRLRKDLVEFDDSQKQLRKLQTNAIQASEAIINAIQQMQQGLVLPDKNIVVSSENYRPPSPGSELSDLSVEAVGLDIDVGISQSDQRQPRQRAATAPTVIRVESFIRVHDLDIPDDDDPYTPSVLTEQSKLSNANQHGFVFVDSDVAPILHKLCKLGYRIAVDESSRFNPTKDTERVLAKYKTNTFVDNVVDEWPIPSWKAVHGTDILVWTGDIGHKGFGCDWPVVKARCLVETSPRSLIEFMMDSSRIKEYNKMSLGREDIVKIQEGLDTSEEESHFGFAGDCKIVRALNKPRMIPKTIETLSLTYSKPLTTSPGSYMTVSRSIFEDDSGEHKSPSANTIRSEMLLGVTIYRPANADHSVTEITNVTHVFSPGVPEMLARRVAPSSAYNMMKDIQTLFMQRK